MSKFSVGASDFDKIVEVAKRAEREVFPLLGLSQDRTTTLMDMSAAHKSCPLDLDALLEADAHDFAHDVMGVRQHMDRTSGVLGGSFMPRFAKGSA